MSWITGVGAAVSIKLSSSIDDVIWLAPFLTNSTSPTARLHNAAIYVGICLVQTIIATAIARSGENLVGLLTKNAENAWSADKILTVFAGSMLAVYSVKLTYEYIQEMRAEGESSGEAEAQIVTDEEALGEVALMSVEQEGHSQRNTEASRTWALFIMAFLGSVDDLTLFVPMLVGKGFDMVQLIVGGFIAASAIALLCVFLGLCKPVASCLSRIPLAAIVVVFAVILLVKGFLMH